jgi:hypothetical protein
MRILGVRSWGIDGLGWSVGRSGRGARKRVNGTAYAAVLTLLVVVDSLLP